MILNHIDSQIRARNYSSLIELDETINQRYAHMGQQERQEEENLENILANNMPIQNSNSFFSKQNMPFSRTTLNRSPVPISFDTSEQGLRESVISTIKPNYHFQNRPSRTRTPQLEKEIFEDQKTNITS